MGLLAVDYSSSSTLKKQREQRIRNFILVYAALNVPFLLIGLFTVSTVPILLGMVMMSYIYCAIYYWLLRIGYGIHATMFCALILVAMITYGSHFGGGVLSASNAFYFLLLVGLATVLDDARALDAIMVMCVVAYGGLALYESYIELPYDAEYHGLYQGGLNFTFPIIATLIAMLACWLVVRFSVLSLHRSTMALEASRMEAESRANENEALMAQVQATNESLLTTQERLRKTIDVLSLPLIPLMPGVTLLPLVGYLDEQRAQKMLESLLHGIHMQRAQTVIIDLTGLQELDTQASAALLQSARAAQLLGSKVILTGISAQAAAQLVAQGIAITGVQTVANLGQAISEIIEQQQNLKGFSLRPS